LLADQIRAEAGPAAEIERTLDTLDDWASELRDVALELSGE
jgi:hypothetical protein